MPWAVAAAVVGGVAQNQAAKKGAKASQQGTDATVGEQRRQYDQTRTDQLPFLQAGTGALTQMQALNKGDFSSFHASPDYQFAFDQGMQGLDRGAAARGGLYSGGHTADTIKYGQGMAAQQYGNYYARLQSMAGQGQTTGANLGSLGANMANQIGSAYMQNGVNRASSFQQQGNNWANTANQLGQFAQYKWGR